MYVCMYVCMYVVRSLGFRKDLFMGTWYLCRSSGVTRKSICPVSMSLQLNTPHRMCVCVLTPRKFETSLFLAVLQVRRRCGGGCADPHPPSR